MASAIELRSSAQDRDRTFTSDKAIVLYVATFVLLLHLLTNFQYGYFGDELYHMACGEHLAWGYVDQPPVIALVAWITRHLFGTSLFAIRLFPALSAFGTVWITGVLTRELGGGRFAQVLAAVCAACGGTYLAGQRLFTMNAWEPLLWMGCSYFVIRIIKTGDQKLWLWFGLLAGVGLENKYSMGVFGLGVVVGLLLTKERRAFAHKWIWIAGLIAFAIFLPNLIWNIKHDFPFVQLMHNIRASGRDIQLGPVEYVIAQIIQMNATTSPVWLLGLLYFFFWKQGQRFRVLSWTFLTVLTVFIVLHGKDYYAAPVYPFLFAGGAIVLEQVASRKHMAWIKPALIGFIVLVTVAILPMMLPVLSPEAFLRYQSKFPLKPKPQEKSMLEERMPHIFAMCFGWDEMVEAAAKAYFSVPPAERADTAILSQNFASAGAIDLLGPKYGLPKAIGGHQNYWIWGPRNYTGQTVILIGSSVERARRSYNEVTVVAEVNNPYASPWINGPVLLCRSPKHYRSIAEVWPKFKNWD